MKRKNNENAKSNCRRIHDSSLQLPLHAGERNGPGGTAKTSLFLSVKLLHPCGFGELLVVDGQGKLVGRVSQQGILRVLFSSLLDPVNVSPFEGRIMDYSDLAILLDEVLIKEGVNHLSASVNKVIERDIRTLPATTDIIHATAIMVLGKETVLPVEEGGKLVGVVKLVQLLGVLGDMLISMSRSPCT